MPCRIFGRPVIARLLNQTNIAVKGMGRSSSKPSDWKGLPESAPPRVFKENLPMIVHIGVFQFRKGNTVKCTVLASGSTFNKYLWKNTCVHSWRRMNTLRVNMYIICIIYSLLTCTQCGALCQRILWSWIAVNKPPFLNPWLPLPSAPGHLSSPEEKTAKITVDVEGIWGYQVSS